MEKEKLKTIYDLKLHEELRIDGTLTIQRVPGGWNYKYYEGFVNGYDIDWKLSNIIFVPYHNEFQVYEPFDLPI